MKTRWKITGTLTTTSPLHIGNGDITTFMHASLMDAAVPSEVQSVVKDISGKPCIPGTALKGVLRSWAERMLLPKDHNNSILQGYQQYENPIRRIFGDRDVTTPKAESGWAVFCTAAVPDPMATLPRQFSEHVPYWNGASWTGILSHVCIDRSTGAAAHNKLYFEEFVPEGIAFDVEIDATRLTRAEIQLLLAILETGSSHPSHPFQLGANSADGWGRMNWKRTDVSKCDSPPKSSASNSVGFSCCTTKPEPCIEPATIMPHVPTHDRLELTLNCQGPFLVNDASRTHQLDDDDNKPNFSPLKRADGGIWLPASSLRGALRERAEFLLKSLNPKAMCDPNGIVKEGSIVRIFGQTDQAARLQITEPKEVGQCETKPQDFVAIDRFTGGAADGAKFDARYADKPVFTTTLTLHSEGLQPEDVALLWLTIRQLCMGQIHLGWGGAKGYGHVTGIATSHKNSSSAYESETRTLVERGPIDEATRNWLKSQIGALFVADTIDVQKPANIGSDLQELRSIPDAKTFTDQPTIPVATLISGRLSIEPKSKKPKEFVYQLFFESQGKEKNVTVPESEVRSDLRGTARSQYAVDFEMNNGKRVRIRTAGEPWDLSPKTKETSHQSHKTAIDRERFANPYYFVRLEDRTKFQGDLRDIDPTSQRRHERYLPGYFSGTLRVKLTAETPLLICAPHQKKLAGQSKPEHEEYDLLLKGGKPLLASSSVRGMLRSAFETITNSRFGVFPGKQAEGNQPAIKHGRRLGFRSPANLTTTPARVILDPSAESGLALEFLPGTSLIQPFPLSAAWYGSYSKAIPITPRGFVVSHGTKLWAFLTPWNYCKKFQFWNVEEVQPFVPGGGRPTTSPSRRICSSPKSASEASWGQSGWYLGYVCITLNNMQGKHDERFFFSDATQFSDANPTKPIPLTNANCQNWRQLIEDYQDQHQREIGRNETVPPPLKAPRVFSRHVSVTKGKAHLDAQKLKVGDLCYAEVDKQIGGVQLKALYPVTISRKLYDKSPLDCLPEGLQPATSIKELSPADRIFGWVNQDHDLAKGTAVAAFRSLVRVGPVVCTNLDPNEAIEKLDPPMTLAILAQPKPQQGRFYVGDMQGKAFDKRLTKEDAGYSKNNRIRGSKVYPHHSIAGNATSYKDALTWKNQNSHALSSAKSDQNRSIKGWVKPGATFEFDLHLKNLSDFELGAIAWLLSLPESHCLRLGLGKPLGFGSVSVQIDPNNSVIADGADWIGSLLAGGTPLDKMELEKLTPFQERFKQTITAQNPTLLSSFEKSAGGFGTLPIHYPRLPGEPIDEHFHWFVNNEKTKGNSVHYSLPDLIDDVSLPSFPNPNETPR